MNLWLTTALGGAGGGLVAMAAVPPGTRLEAVRHLIVATVFSVLISNGLLRIGTVAARMYFPSLPEITGTDVALMVSAVFGVASWWVVFAFCNWLEKGKNAPGGLIDDAIDVVDRIRGTEESAE